MLARILEMFGWISKYYVLICDVRLSGTTRTHAYYDHCVKDLVCHKFMCLSVLSLNQQY